MTVGNAGEPENVQAAVESAPSTETADSESPGTEKACFSFSEFADWCKNQPDVRFKDQLDGIRKLRDIEEFCQETLGMDVEIFSVPDAQTAYRLVTSLLEDNRFQDFQKQDSAGFAKALDLYSRYTATGNDSVVSSGYDLERDTLDLLISDDADVKKIISLRGGLSLINIAALLRKQTGRLILLGELKRILGTNPFFKMVGDDRYIVSTGEEGSAKKPERMPVRNPIPMLNSVKRSEELLLLLGGCEMGFSDPADALAQVCEYCISKRPAVMESIHTQPIKVRKSVVFYKQSVPPKGYSTLSNGL